MRLKCLCPSLKHITGSHVSTVVGGHDLHLILTEQTPHTTTLSLTYRFPEGESRPDLILRIYHDARQAEVLSRRCRLTDDWLYTDRHPGETALLCKWRLNRFLYKWLNYCRRQGHDFIETPTINHQLADLALESVT
ncbi:MAG: DUF1249 domain-containing protein [Thiotrichales bacterium]